MSNIFDDPKCVDLLIRIHPETLDYFLEPSVPLRLSIVYAIAKDIVTKIEEGGFIPENHSGLKAYPIDDDEPDDILH